MTPRRREHKVIHAVPCPVCGAPRGSPCRLTTTAERATGRGRLLVHGPRREAWQERRRAADGPDFYLRTTGPEAGVLFPQSELARRALEGLIPGEPEGEGWRVESAREASDLLVADGWTVE